MIKAKRRSVLDEEKDGLNLPSSKQKQRQAQLRELATLHQKATQDYQQLLALSTHDLRLKQGFFKSWQDNDAEQTNHQTTLDKLAGLREICAKPQSQTPRPGFLQGIADRTRQINANPVSTLVVEPSLHILGLAIKRIISANGLILPMGEAEHPPAPPLTIDANDLPYMAGHLLVDTVAFGGMLNGISHFAKAGNIARAARLRARTAEPRIVGLAQQRLGNSAEQYLQYTAELQSVWYQERNHLQQVLSSLKQVEYRYLNRDFVRPTTCCALSKFLSNKNLQGKPHSTTLKGQHRVLTFNTNLRVFVKNMATRPSINCEILTDCEILAEIKTLDFLSKLHLRKVTLPKMLGVEFTSNSASLYLSYLPGRRVDKYVLDAARSLEPSSFLKAQEATRAVGVALGELHSQGMRPLPLSDIAASIKQLRNVYSELSQYWGPLCPVTATELEKIIRDFQNNPGSSAFAHGEPNLSNFMYARPGGLSMVDFGLGLIRTRHTEPLQSSAQELAYVVTDLYSTDIPAFAELEQLRVELERGYLTTGSITPQSYRFFCLLEYCKLANNQCDYEALFRQPEDYKIIAQHFIGISKEKSRLFIDQQMPISRVAIQAQWRKDQEKIQQLIVQLKELDAVRKANGGVLPPLYEHRNQILSPEALSTAKPINKTMTGAGRGTPEDVVQDLSLAIAEPHIGLAQQQLENAAELQSVWDQEQQHLQQVIGLIKNARDFVAPKPCSALSNFIQKHQLQGQRLGEAEYPRISAYSLPNETRIIAKTERYLPGFTSRYETLAEIESLVQLSSLNLQKAQLPKILAVEFTENTSTIYLSYLPGNTVNWYVNQLSLLTEEHVLFNAEEAVRAVGMALGELHSHGMTPLPQSEVARYISELRVAHAEIADSFGSLFPFTQQEMEAVIHHFQNNPGNCSFAHGDAGLSNFMYDSHDKLSIFDVGLGLSNTTRLPSSYELSITIGSLLDDFPDIAELQHLRHILEQGYLSTNQIAPDSYRFFCLLDRLKLLADYAYSKDFDIKHQHDKEHFLEPEDYQDIARHFIEISTEMKRKSVEEQLPAAWKNFQEERSKLADQIRELDQLRKANGGVLPPLYKHCKSERLLTAVEAQAKKDVLFIMNQSDSVDDKDMNDFNGHKINRPFF